MGHITHRAIPLPITLGCLAVVALFVANALSEGDKRDAAEAEEARQQAGKLEREYAEGEQRKIRAIEVEKRRRAAERAEAILELTALSPAQRMRAILSCSTKSECPGGDASAVLEAASSPAERARLSSAYDRSEAAIARANAPLACCDGSFSPTCTCGSPRRGCCSKHQGVCGCSADKN